MDKQYYKDMKYLKARILRGANLTSGQVKFIRKNLIPDYDEYCVYSWFKINLVLNTGLYKKPHRFAAKYD